MIPKAYDLVVIGSGPAGEKGAVQAAYFGKKVALIEKDTFLGGAAVHSGASSKSMRETALYLSGYRQRDLHGLKFTLEESLNFQDFLHRSRVVMQHQRERILNNLERHKVDLYRGSAHFLDSHTISIETPGCEPQLLRGEVILLATGSKPHRPALFPFENPRILDSNKLLKLEGIPQSMIIVGSGTIACEYACVFAALGIHITLVDKGCRLLKFMDAEISAALQALMMAQGIEFYLSDEIKELTAIDQVDITLRTGKHVSADVVLIAAGRDGNTEGLGLEKIGMCPTHRGHLEVNERYQTTIPHIYAAGDVIGFPGLASTSMEQARVAMVHAFDLHYKKAVASVLPLGIYTIPECGMAGETEESLRQKGISYVVGKESYQNNGRGEIIGEKTGFLKLLFHPDDMRLLGVHVIGENAADLVHLGLAAILANAGADLFIQTCFNYPTLSELYKYAAYDAMGRRHRGEWQEPNASNYSRTFEEAFSSGSLP